MPDGTQHPRPEADYYVSTADLALSRLPTRPTSTLSALLRNETLWRVVALAYMVLVVITWPIIVRGDTPPRSVQSLIFSLIICLPFAALILINGFRLQHRTKVPFYRNIDFLKNFVQVIFLFIIFATVFTLVTNLQTNLATSGLNINFNVLVRKFGTEVTEGPDPRQPLTFLNSVPIVGQSLASGPLFQPDTNFRALAVGLVNTLRVVVLSLVATTFLGVFVGIGLLSVNWLVRNLSVAYVEIFRNTPLLVQLFFIYGGVIKALPSRPRDAVQLPGSIYVSGRGFYYPAIVPTDAANTFFVLLLAGVLLGLILRRWRLQVNERTGQPAHGLLYFLLSVVGLGAVGLVLSFASGGTPFVIEAPQASNFNFTGGASFSAEYLALFLGLTLYTSAFVADIVRAGIQSVQKGQIEAAHALGLSNAQTLSKIVLPQALRLALPPLTNQYLNLTKNSSLGIAIGFTDVYNVATITYNQTGQSVALFAILMVTYLALSLIISVVMNIFNNSLKLKTR